MLRIQPLTHYTLWGTSPTIATPYAVRRYAQPVLAYLDKDFTAYNNTWWYNTTPNGVNTTSKASLDGIAFTSEGTVIPAGYYIVAPNPYCKFYSLEYLLNKILNS